MLESAPLTGHSGLWFTELYSYENIQGRVEQLSIMSSALIKINFMITGEKYVYEI